MKKSNSITISKLRDREVPQGLYDSILLRIEHVEGRNALLRALGLGCIAIASCVAFLEALAYTSDEVYLSGFSEYARLLFTDSDVVLLSWHEFGLSLIETLPAVPIMLICLTLSLLIWSVVRASRNAAIVLRQHSATA